MDYVSKGKGPDTCLLLDTSGSMAGEPFNQMMVAVITFINGNLHYIMLTSTGTRLSCLIYNLKYYIKLFEIDIAGIAASLGIEENIGIATFGDQTRVIQHMTNEYDQIIKSLGG